MLKKEVKHLGLRIAPELHQKLAYISNYEGRSLNGQVYYLIQQCIRAFEREHGPITPADLRDAQP